MANIKKADEMELGLKDKIAFVTGTGSQAGIGKSVALTLVR